MGQKVSPKAFRIGSIFSWDSTWYADKKLYKQYLHEDITIKKYLKVRLKDSGISSINIERSVKKVILNIYTAKPGVIIGRGGELIEILKEDLKKKFGMNFEVNIKEVHKPEADAMIIADSVARQIERRMPYRRAVKMALKKAKDAGVLGVKVYVGGRLNGVEIARGEFFKEGNIPLHTLRADISFAAEKASTTYGAISVKVWVYKGMIFKSKKSEGRMLVKTAA